jgi:hypothetical protein
LIKDRSSMNRLSSLAAPVAVLALTIVVAACGAAPASPAPATPAPTAAPTGTPVITPVPVQTPKPSAGPSQGGVGDKPIDLDVALGHDISVVVTDRSGHLVGARSGKGADGMSVRWGDAIVRNLDANTIQVTWVGFPQDETVGLVVELHDDGLLLRFGQAAPYPNTDAMGADRVMVFDFDMPVSADIVAVEFTTADD